MAIIQIITDSTCTLPPDLPQEVRCHIHVVRTSIQFGSHETWVEGSFTLEQFYQHIESTPIWPNTSQPSTHEFIQTFKTAAERGPVLAILLSAALSSTYSTGAAIAKELASLDIMLFDSQFLSSALGYMVAEAATLAVQGRSRSEILAQLTWRRQQTALFMALDTLDYLRRGGRVNVFQSGLASVLNLKPLLSVERGELKVIARVRSRQRSLERLLQFAEKQVNMIQGPIWTSTMHGNAPETARWLAKQMARRFPVERSYLTDVPASIALHGGPGVVGLMITPAIRTPQMKGDES